MSRNRQPCNKSIDAAVIKASSQHAMSSPFSSAEHPMPRLPVKLELLPVLPMPTQSSLRPRALTCKEGRVIPADRDGDGH